MLYKLSNAGRSDRLDPIPFEDFAQIGLLEKDLENMMSSNLDVIFEQGGIMPIFQERQRQPEGDIYALDEHGDLVIFELKRSKAGEDAVQQALRYAQNADHWIYKDLQSKYRNYRESNNNENVDLRIAHQAAFELEQPVEPSRFNQRQRLIIVGSAADERTMRAVAYWKRTGVSIDFLPYRIFRIDGELYFEFFAPPYDERVNPGENKGVLFDTNRNWIPDAIWNMIDGDYVAAYGDVKDTVTRLSPGDIVFYSHQGYGVVAAARVKRGKVREINEDTLARDVEFLTEKPSREAELKYLPFSDVKKALDKNFYWAATIKTPYLSLDEAQTLLAKLNESG